MERDAVSKEPYNPSDLSQTKEQNGNLEESQKSGPVIDKEQDYSLVTDDSLEKSLIIDLDSKDNTTIDPRSSSANEADRPLPLGTTPEPRSSSTNTSLTDKIRQVIDSHDNRGSEVVTLSHKYENAQQATGTKGAKDVKGVKEAKDFKSVKGKKAIDKRIDALTACEICHMQEESCNCSQQAKDKLHVEQLVTHEIEKIKTQNRFQLLEQTDQDRPKSVQSKIRNLFSTNKGPSAKSEKNKTDPKKPESKTTKPKLNTNKDPKNEHRFKPDPQGRETKRVDRKTTPPNLWNR